MKKVDLKQLQEIEEVREKSKRNFKNSIISAAVRFFLPISVAITSIHGIKAWIVDPSGYVHKSYNGIPSPGSQVLLVRRPLTGWKDTLIEYVDEFENWATPGSNFHPNLTDQDTLQCYVTKDTLGKTFSSKTWMTGGTETTLETFLRDPTKWSSGLTSINVINVKDTSFSSAPLFGYVWLAKNPSQPCSAEVDTTLSPYHINDLVINLQYQDSVPNHGDPAYLLLKKVAGDTVWLSDTIRFVIDTLYWDAMQVKSNGNTGSDTLWFPLEKIVIDNQPPTISNLTQLLDQDSLGAWLINAQIDDASGISQAWLLRKVNSISDSSQADSIQGNQYFFTFPAVSLNYPYNSLEYAVKAIDNSTNHNQAVSNWHNFKAYPKDLSLEQILLPSIADSGSVIQVKAIGKNYGIQQHHGKFKAAIGNFYSDSLNALLNGQATDTIIFKPCTLNCAINSYNVVMKVKLPGDVNTSNDSLSQQIQIKKPYLDIALLEILSPPDTVQADSSYNVIVRLKNQSSLDDSAKIACEIRKVSPDSLVYSDSSKLYLPAGSVQELQFTDWIAPYDGQLYLVKFKNLVPDSDATNDSLMKQVYVKQVNVSDFENARKEKVIKAWPIPASAYLNLWLPKNAKASVYDVSGNYITELKNKNGSALWNLTDEKGRKVANGIYFIKIEDEKQRKIEKAAVIR